MASINLWSKIQQICLDVMFPPTDRSRFVRELDAATINELPEAQTIDDDFISAVFDYQNKTTKAIVQAAKYDGSRKAARLMGKTMYDEIFSLCERRRIISKQIGLVPIPLSPDRLRNRGFNQCQRIIQAITTAAGSAKHLQTRDVLEKTRPTQPQTNLSRNKRKQNLRSCFQLTPEASVSGEDLIIIDDVTTTGATFKAAQQALQAGNPNSISALAFAH